MTASQLSPSSSHKPSILILADSDQDRNKWVGLLNELHRILKKNKLKDRFVYVPKEAYDSTLPLIKTTQSAAILGEPLQSHGSRHSLSALTHPDSSRRSRTRRSGQRGRSFCRPRHQRR